jgi:hypothetical protein
LRNNGIGSSLKIVSSYPSHVPQDNGLSALSKALAPATVQVTYCSTNALPFRVEWASARGPVRFYGLSPDAAAAAAHDALTKGTVERAPRAHLPVTEPLGHSPFADAMRELIADVDEERAQKRRPVLRIVRRAE